MVHTSALWPAFRQLHTCATCREPGLLSAVITPHDAMPVIESESDLRLEALETLAAEQSAQGQRGYVAPDDRYGLFPSSAAPAAPTLRTQQYAHPSAAAAAVPAPPAATSTGAVAAEAAAPSPPTRAAKAPPKPRAQMGTFSNMMMARPESPAEAPVAAAAAGAAASPARKTRGPFAPNVHTYTEEGDGLADMLFGGGGGRARKPKPAAAPRETAPPAPPPLVDLLGGFGDDPVTHAAPDMAASAGTGLDDLLGGGSGDAPAAAPVDDLLAGLDSMHVGAAPAAGGGDLFGSAAPAAAAPPVDLMSGLDLLAPPPPAAGGAIPGPGLPQNGGVMGGLAPGYAVPQPVAQGHVGMQAGGMAAPPQMGMQFMPQMQPPAMDPMMQAGAVGGPGPGAPPADPASDVARNSGTLQAKNPDKKGDAFADLLSF